MSSVDYITSGKGGGGAGPGDGALGGGWEWV